MMVTFLDESRILRVYLCSTYARQGLISRNKYYILMQNLES